MQDADYRWFEAHCRELYNEYGDAYIAIKNETVLGRYRTYAEAVNETKKAHEPGTFIVQRCAENADANTVYIASAHFMPEGVLV